MTEINRYALMMEAYTELKPEIETARKGAPTQRTPSQCLPCQP
jgi:hypothetical protein